MNFTVMGDAVNIAARLEGANKFYGTSILVSDNVEAAAHGKILFRIIDKVAVKGKKYGTTIFEPLCIMQDASSEEYYELLELSSMSKEAFALYLEKDFLKAIERYKLIQEKFPTKSKAVTPLIERCEMYSKVPPDNWDEVTYMNEK
jgi:adenylate cyclase